MKKVGKVTHYYEKAGEHGVAILQLEGTLKKSDSVQFRGHGVDFEQPVIELQINKKEIEEASKSEIIGFAMAEGTPKLNKEGIEVFKL